MPPSSSSDRAESTAASSSVKDSGLSNTLAAEYADHIFRIHTEDGIATGFRAPDGRLVTSFSAIRGSREIIAEQNGKRYRVGKSVQVDDINDLVVLEPADKLPLPQHPLPLSTRRVEDGERVVSAGIPSREFYAHEGVVTRQIKQEDYRNYFGSQPKLSLPPSERHLSDALHFSKRPLLELSYDMSSSMYGGPLISEKRDVVGVTLTGNYSNAYAIPVDKLRQLLEQKPQDSKFVVSTGYENGLQTYLSNWSNAPHVALQKSTIPLISGIGFAAAAAKTGPGAYIWLGGAMGYRMATDLKGYLSSTNDLDATYHAAGMISDGGAMFGTALMAASHYVPRLRPIGLITTGLGLAARLGCELVPNRLVIQSIKRRDGDDRKPFAN